ncbi:uncharacterized protein LOC125384353 [Haliotis rufescens]|uniref:uncharacterized protein LOC125384353 n=1 Tax=Haliotis rufescens TaxID=6454 RepID=UPI00201F4BB5|nr:uncharacterized protein LOC125384353 [Haliotis rufescens]
MTGLLILNSASVIVIKDTKGYCVIQNTSGNGQHNALFDESTKARRLVDPSPEVACQAVADMVVKEEVFSFVKTANRSWMSGEGSFVAEESENYFNVTFCYYEAYERRECMYSEDRGASYRGWVNVTADGRPCQRWDENSYPIAEKHYDGDFDGNFCRQTWYYQRRPYCVIDEKLYGCDIPVCDSTGDLPNVAMRKLYRSPPSRSDNPIENIVNGEKGKPTFAIARPFVEPWLQVDLSEDYEIYSITVYKAYNWWPYNTRRIVAYVSQKQWDFLRFGAYNCDGPYNPARTKSFRFQCRRPLTGTFVTLHNFVHYDPYYNVDNYNYFEVSEIVIRGKGHFIEATGCGKSLGVRTGDVKDFQFTSSTDGKGSYGYHARLNRATGWCSHSGDPNPYIQVDLLTPMILEGVILQGWNDGRDEYLPHNFTVWTGINEGNLTVYENRIGDAKVFHLDSTYASTVSQKFLLSTRVLTRVVRLHLYQETSPLCVRFDLIGCPKRVTVDLKCAEGSTSVGLYRMPGHSFYQNVYNNSFVTPGVTSEECKNKYLSNTHIYASYRYSFPDEYCTYLVGNRYSRHNQNWWVTGYGGATEYGQVLCLAGR